MTEVGTTLPAPPSFPCVGDGVSLPSFSHQPPRHRHVTWPGSIDHQWCHQPPSLLDIWVHVDASGFLTASDTLIDEKTSAINALVFTPGSTAGPLWLTRPWQPIRRRVWGFGTISKARTCTHDTPNPVMLIHFVWTFLTTLERRRMISSLSSWHQYARLRRKACCKSLRVLHQPRPAVVPLKMEVSRAVLHSSALLRFDFNYGDFVRWLGGEYTNRHRDWTTEWNTILESPCQPLPEDYPEPRYDLAFRIQTEGVPLRGHFETPMATSCLRDTYNNHPAVNDNTDQVAKKFAKEEWKGYHVHFLRFLYSYLYGLILNPLQWVFDKGKGRICVDCTNGPDPKGAANTYIPKPSVDNEEQCPPVFYQSAFRRLLRRILQMRISRPAEPILVHADDIEAAFRRILYHPDMAIAFGYVFEDYLMIPVGEVFGSRSAPSFYCVLADVRQALAAITPPTSSSNFHSLVNHCHRHVDESLPLAQVPPDSHHPRLSGLELERAFNASFVDDNGVVAFLRNILSAINQSVTSAFTVFGASGVDRRGDCLQHEKWDNTVSEEFLFLGFLINTRAMTVSWPFFKRKRLFDELDTILKRPTPVHVSPKEMARIVGVVRSASEVAPWGTFLSFNLENALQQAAAHGDSTNRQWWKRARIFLSKIAVATMRQIMETLLVPENDPLWTRPIYLQLDRDLTHTVISDASYAGLGGWSPEFKFLWRITREDLINYGFQMKPLGTNSQEPSEPSADGLHINPLEFVAALINLWIALRRIMDLGPRDGGYVLGLLSDNTSALAWMSYASRTPDPLLQGLARLGAALLVRAAAFLTKVVPSHIAGKLNIEADALSRPVASTGNKQGQQRIPSLDSVIAECSRLRTCRICLLPSALLRRIASVTSSQPTEDTFEQITTSLLKLELHFLPIGVVPMTLTSTISND
jgi:hypothetical protein